MTDIQSIMNSEMIENDACWCFKPVHTCEISTKIRGSFFSLWNLVLISRRFTHEFSYSYGLSHSGSRFWELETFRFNFLMFVLRLISVLLMLGAQVPEPVDRQEKFEGWYQKWIVCIKDLTASRLALVSLEQLKENFALHSNSKQRIRKATQNTDRIKPVLISQVSASQKPNKLSSCHLCEIPKHFI